ncbi:MAG: hypothetical protein LZF86_100027 [Nitrospira sp.]|nr:MAG: hypothetical protein LZF86_100027 [Nitrospira sp.]
MKSEILFFVPEWPALDSPILHAQVLSVASFLNREGFSCRFAGAETSIARAQEATAMIAAQYGVPADVAPVLSPHAGAWGIWKACRSVCQNVRSTGSHAAITHIYSRSFTGSMWARKLGRHLNAISIFDIRGIVGLENQLEKGSSLQSKVISYLELHESRQADRLATVSNNLGAYLNQQTGRRDVVVIPSCVDENRFHFDASARNEIRSTLGLNETSILLCYSGGTSAWQRLGDIVSLLKRICLADTRCKALFLTTGQGEVSRRLKDEQFPADQTIVLGAAHNEVHRYLSAADVGLIMRHDTMVNNVASPVKVGEYLVCGLPVILSRGIGDYSTMLPAAGVGMLLDESADMCDQILQFIRRDNFSALRDKAIHFANSKLTMSSNLNQYHSLYANDNRIDE